MKMLLKGLLVALIVIVLDQWSKQYIFNILQYMEHPIIEVVPFFSLVKVYNYGVSFGMFNDLTYGSMILSVIAIGITLILCFMLLKIKKLYMGVAFGLIIGGAIGNIIDRVRFGAVADFLDFYIGDYHWPAFNMADSAVFIGVAIIVLDGFIGKENGGGE
jgi:signal peptidase II